MAKFIYIVTSGSYSDYTIDSVFSTKERAEHYCSEHSGYLRIEEYEIDAEVGKVWKDAYEVIIDAATGALIRKWMYREWVQPGARGYTHACDQGTSLRKDSIFRATSFDDFDHALKLAAEARQAWLRTQTEPAG